MLQNMTASALLVLVSKKQSTMKKSMNILISGGSKGLGAELVVALLARRPDNHVFTFSRNQENIEELKKKVSLRDETFLARLYPSLGDIASKEDMQRVIDEAYGALGSIDMLINNVGMFLFDGEVSEVPIEDCEKTDGEFEVLYATDADYLKKKAYRTMLQTNYLGNRAFI